MTTRPPRADDVWSIDDLELELRKLPGVRAAGFEDADDMLLVQLHITDRPEDRTERNERSGDVGAEPPVSVSASRIAARYSDRRVALEVVRWRTAPAVAPPAAPLPAPDETGVPAVHDDATVAVAAGESDRPNRPRLLAVLAFPDTDELEVHLILDGKRTIGRAPASAGVEGAVKATIEAVRELGTGLHPRIRWARALGESNDDDRVVVAVALDGVDDSTFHYGLAAGTSPIDAASRATLDALNRRLTRTA